jgi:serine/threonine protein kinase
MAFKRNILISEQHVAKICDLELLQILHKGDEYQETGVYIDPQYYAPYESLTEEDPRPTEASDVYSMGCVGLLVRVAMNH